MPSYYLSEDLSRFGDLGKTDPDRFDLFMKWYAAVMEPGALDGKTKKLIAYAVANALPEPYCIDSYASSCSDTSITPEEMAEALEVAAAIKGGGVIAHWAQTLNTIARKS
jgi:alkylhydroperoxidase/carboxymuconolactone decarboxylase family protein